MYVFAVDINAVLADGERLTAKSHGCGNRHTVNESRSARFIGVYVGVSVDIYQGEVFGKMIFARRRKRTHCNRMVAADNDRYFSQSICFKRHFAYVPAGGGYHTQLAHTFAVARQVDSKLSGSAESCVREDLGKPERNESGICKFASGGGRPCAHRRGNDPKLIFFHRHIFLFIKYFLKFLRCPQKYRQMRYLLIG